MRENKHIGPEFALSRFEIRNFKGILSLDVVDLPEYAQWIFLTGENGYGKTSVLQGIALAIIGFEPHTFEYQKNENLELDWEIHGYEDELGGIKGGKYVNILSPKAYQESPIYTKVCCYGSSRLEVASENSKQEKSPSKSLFNSSSLLLNIEHQLSRWYFKKDDFPEFDQKYTAVTNLLIDLLGISK